MDYGFSTVSDEYGRGSSIGCTPKFAAPELFLPNPYQLLPADVYSLGMTLRWLLKAGKGKEWIKKISSGALLLVGSMTHPDPTQRPKIRQVLSLLTLVQAACHRKVVEKKMKRDVKHQIEKYISDPLSLLLDGKIGAEELFDHSKLDRLAELLEPLIPRQI